MNPISICIIGKNEESTVEDCLISIPKESFEIIFVDTGSTDCTKKIVSKYTTKIFDFTWNDDFSAARNFSIGKATNNWVLILDCDEKITYISIKEILKLIKEHPSFVGEVLINSRTLASDGANTTLDLVNRLFDRRKYRYSGIIHEQVTAISGDETFDTITIPLELFHSGYSGSKEKIDRKMQRNIDLLIKAIASTPDSPYLYYQLGQGFYLKKDYEEASIHFSKALSYDVDPKFTYVKMLMVSYGYSLYYLNHLKDAIIFCEEVYPHFDKFANFIFLCGLLYMEAGIWNKAILNFILSTTLKEGACDVSVPAYYNLGLIYETIGELDIALKFFIKAPSFLDSNEHIKKLKKIL